MIYRFEIDSPLLGYRASVEGHTPAYAAFKDKVRFLANVARVPLSIEEGVDVRILVMIYWKKAARIDGKNVYAAIEDGLFKQDRKVAAGLWSRLEEQGREYATVHIEVTRT